MRGAMTASAARSLAWGGLTAVARRLLPAPVRAPLERRLGERNDRRRTIDLRAAAVLREAPEERLRDPAQLARLLAESGLNDELLEQYPPELHPFTGRGLRLWQMPGQFAPLLVELSRRGVKRYMEIGVRHGGSFVATVEYLSRFGALTEAAAVDVEPLRTLLPYPLEQPAVRVVQADTQAPAFAAWVERQPPFDLVFIDGLHTYDACRRDLETVRDRARLIAVHDITNDLVPDVGRVWRELRADHAADFEFHEFTDQPVPPGEEPGVRVMGIGLAVRRHRA
jgi:predicted O-methyltransferase YrrM